MGKPTRVDLGLGNGMAFCHSLVDPELLNFEVETSGPTSLTPTGSVDLIFGYPSQFMHGIVDVRDGWDNFIAGEWEFRTDGVKVWRVVIPERLTNKPTSSRHPSVKHLMQFFVYPDISEVSPVAKTMGECAAFMAMNLKDCPEKTAGLRKLLEAKDCFMRALEVK